MQLAQERCLRGIAFALVRHVVERCQELVPGRLLAQAQSLASRLCSVARLRARARCRPGCLGFLISLAIPSQKTGSEACNCCAALR